MARRRKQPKWDRKPCGCVKTRLAGKKAVIRCTRHRDKPSKRDVYYFDGDGIVRAEAPQT